jgi:glyoxylase-like metal-dependent hydrolase (beta-lactamase superfamily II)
LDALVSALISKENDMTNDTPQISRRALLKGATLTVGAAAFLKTALTPTIARAQGEMPPGTLHSFTQNGVTFHTYVSPAPAVSVTSHIVEFDDQLLLVDATMLPPTAMEVDAAIKSTGKPVAMAVLSHEHPDHWGGASFIEGVTFSTLPQVRDGMRAEATGGNWPQPTNVLNGPDVTPGMTEIAGVPVEFRHYENTEAPHMLVTVLPEQKVAIVQDLVYNGVYFAPGVDRANWIATLETLRDDPAFDTLLVGHGLPTTRGDLDTAIAYIKVLDDMMTNAATPDDAIAGLKAAFPGYTGEFLLSLIAEYWER